jgi:signal transduction histidine kinase
VVLHRPAGDGPAWIILSLSAVVGVSLVIALVATLVLARTIVRPLTVLGDAARAFGRGETGVRTRLRCADELGAVGRAFDEMAEQIERLLRAQRAMMADISHELRTPLTRVKLALDLASADPHAAKQVLDDVDADLAEIERIIEDVFALVRLDSTPPRRSVGPRWIWSRSWRRRAPAARLTTGRTRSSSRRRSRTRAAMATAR